MTAKRIALAIAILSAAGTALAAVEGALPPAWTLAVSALGAGAYASVKSLLSTTEAWGAALSIIGSVIAAAAGVAPKSVAVGAAAVAGRDVASAALVPEGHDRGTGGAGSPRRRAQRACSDGA